MLVTRNVMMKYMAPAGDGTGGGGGGSGDGGEAERLAAEKAAAEKAAAEQAAADKAAAEKAAAEEAAKGGKTGPSDEEARLLKENMQKKEALRKKDEEIAALKKQFEGIDPEAVRKMLAERADAEKAELEKKGDYERLKARMAEEHGKEVKTLQDQIAELQAQVSKASGTINELSIGSQFSQSQFIGEELTLTPAKARVIYADHFDLEDGKVVGYDKPRGAANRTALVDQYGTPVSFDDALRKIVDADPEKDHLLKSKIKSGAGSDSRKTTQPANKQEPTDSVSRIAAGLKGLMAGQK